MVTRCYSLSLVVPLVVTRCTTRCHSLSLDVRLVCLFINDRQNLFFKCFAEHIFCLHLFHVLLTFWVIKLQKHSLRGVVKKNCCENMQQIYRRTPMPKCDFNKVAKQLSWNYISAWVENWRTAHLLHIFRTPFLKSNSGRLLLYLGVQ